MTRPHLLQRVSRYGCVGIAAAAVHAGTLLALGTVLPLELANPLAFLTASIAGYAGHALVTFREETGGRSFARRWLVLQYAVNLCISALLPLLLESWAPATLRTVILVFTPTVLNVLIWSRAARFSARRRSTAGTPPLIHADDLGLAPGVDSTILSLARSRQLNGASLLVDGPSAAAAAEGWRALDPSLPLCLHLCLTEGPGIPGSPDLPAGFGTLLVASLLPWQRRRLVNQLDQSIEHQIQRFRELTGLAEIHLDGHQHIHLVPLVLQRLLILAPKHRITWIRTTCEPLPTGLPLRCWREAIEAGGLLKWLLLQALSQWAKPRLRKTGIRTNSRFGGVFFTGRMVGEPLRAIHRELSTCGEGRIETRSLLLAHPAGPVGTDALNRHGFQQSAVFFASIDRQKEWRALETL
jgi:putative flippase GtrA